MPSCKGFKKLLLIRGRSSEPVQEFPHHLQFILPELLLSGLVQKREISDMVNEDVA